MLLLRFSVICLMMAQSLAGTGLSWVRCVDADGHTHVAMAEHACSAQADIVDVHGSNEIEPVSCQDTLVYSASWISIHTRNGCGGDLLSILASGRMLHGVLMQSEPDRFSKSIFAKAPLCPKAEWRAIRTVVLTV